MGGSLGPSDLHCLVYLLFLFAFLLLLLLLLFPFLFLLFLQLQHFLLFFHSFFLYFIKLL